jgi:hypothetical protein
MMKKSAAESKGSEGGDDVSADQQDKEGAERKEQKVYVLDRGFMRWQELYGEDERLTEGYVKEIWKDGY